MTDPTNSPPIGWPNAHPADKGRARASSPQPLTSSAATSPPLTQPEAQTDAAQPDAQVDATRTWLDRLVKRWFDEGVSPLDLVDKVRALPTTASEVRIAMEAVGYTPAGVEEAMAHL